jgi:hypothetical protein
MRAFLKLTDSRGEGGTDDRRIQENEKPEDAIQYILRLLHLVFIGIPVHDRHG